MLWYVYMMCVINVSYVVICVYVCYSWYAVCLCIWWYMSLCDVCHYVRCMCIYIYIYTYMRALATANRLAGCWLLYYGMVILVLLCIITITSIFVIIIIIIIIIIMSIVLFLVLYPITLFYYIPGPADCWNVFLILFVDESNRQSEGLDDLCIWIINDVYMCIWWYLPLCDVCHYVRCMCVYVYIYIYIYIYMRALAVAKGLAGCRLLECGMLLLLVLLCIIIIMNMSIILFLVPYPITLRYHIPGPADCWNVFLIFFFGESNRQSEGLDDPMDWWLAA